MSNHPDSSSSGEISRGKIAISPRFFDLVTLEFIRAGKMTLGERVAIQAVLERHGIDEAATVFMRMLETIPTKQKS